MIAKVRVRTIGIGRTLAEIREMFRAGEIMFRKCAGDFRVSAGCFPESAAAVIFLMLIVPSAIIGKISRETTIKFR